MGKSAELVHDAFLYSSDEEFVSTLTPLLRDGLGRGHAAVAAVTRRNIDLLRDSLGAEADLVTFLDRDEWYQRPAATVAGWEHLLEQANSRGQSHIRIIGEVAFGDRHATWTRYEAALNSVFASTPAWITCPYDMRALPETVIADARRTHPVITSQGRSPSGRYQRPEELLSSIHEPMPPVTGEPAVTMGLTSLACVAKARDLLRQTAAATGCPADLVDEALIVLSEIAGNSLRHGAGERWLRIWSSGDGPLVCEVTDEGDGLTDVLIGYRPPGPDAAASRGLWLASQLCDWLAIVHDNGLTRARFAVNPC